MMLSKPNTEEQQQQEETAPVLKRPTPLPASLVKKKTAEDAVADLERRLQMLGDVPTTTAAPTSSGTTGSVVVAVTPPPAAAAAAAPAAAPAATIPKGGKNALLARIMAAQERAKQPASSSSTNAPPPPPPTFDELMTQPPPPAFDAAVLPAPSTMTFAPPMTAPPSSLSASDAYQSQFEEPPPPLFDAVSLPPPMSFAPSYNNNNNNNSMMMMAPPDDDHNHNVMFFAPSAPALEDLLDNQHQQEQHERAQHLLSMQPMAPPPVQEEESMESILAALEGLSEREKQALLAEQGKILASIEKSKQKGSTSSSADARANAFEQRSLTGALRGPPSSSSSGATTAAASSTTATNTIAGTVDLGNGEQVALHGQEKTRQAIQDGTAVLVQCLSCSNWMQVTGTAALMFCPICQTVSPVDENGAAGMTAEEAMQMKADLELAEQLQKEEYERGESGERRQRTQQQQSTSTSTTYSSPPRTAAAAPATTAQHEPGWMEWLGFGAPAPAPPAHMTESRPLQRGEIGISRPPGNSRGGGLAPVHTGAETITFTPSYDDADQAEDAAFLRHQGSSASRVEERQQPIFNYVADSITSAATSLSTALQMAEDDEGKVHGVDSTGLLAVTTVGRDSNNNQESTTPYERAD